MGWRMMFNAEPGEQRRIHSRYGWRFRAGGEAEQMVPWDEIWPSASVEMSTLPCQPVAVGISDSWTRRENQV